MHPLETYIRDLRSIHSSGAAVKETSYYGSLERLLNAIGKGLKPRVRCIINPANRGAGNPDGGFFTSDQFQRTAGAEPLPGQIPARGVAEVKGTGDNVEKIARSLQVAKYLGRYGQVLVTNYRDFLLVGQGTGGGVVFLERYVGSYALSLIHIKTACEVRGRWRNTARSRRGSSCNSAVWRLQP